jgi:hypothetical protein
MSRPRLRSLTAMAAAAALLVPARSQTPPSPLSSFFATSTGSGAAGGNLGGLDGADRKCRDLAAGADLPGGKWAAYLTTSSENARDRIGPGPWHNVAGTPIADDVDDLHDSGIPADDVLDENGAAVPPSAHDILTGSGQAGGPHPLIATCGDFQVSDSTYYVVVGHSDGGGVGEGGTGGGDVVVSWNAAHLSACSQAGLQATGGEGRTYCFRWPTLVFDDGFESGVLDQWAPI